ncbi:MAG: zinc peptidase, partial [Bosea sp. 32-68-6]
MRTELGIAAYAPLCPWKLAAHLEYVVVQLSQYEDAQPQSVSYLMSARGQSEFSAITLYHGQDRIIIHNDAHNRGRQAANLAHELAHGLLMHTPDSLVGEDGA